MFSFASFITLHPHLLAHTFLFTQPLAIRECTDGSLTVTGVREVEAKTAADLTKLLQESAMARWESRESLAE